MNIPKMTNIHFSRLFAVLCLALPFSALAQLRITNITTQQPSCYGYTDGVAIATATGGVAPYNFRWSDGHSGNYNQWWGIPAGNYAVTVTDAAGGTVNQTFVMGQPTQVVTTITSETAGACGGPGENYIANTIGGQAPYTYAWSTGATGPRVLNLPTGGYYVTVTDARNCPSVKFQEIRPVLGVTVRVVDVVCGGTCDGSAEARVVGGTPPYQYRWNFNNSTTQAIFPLPGGSYTVTVTDGNGCVRSATNAIEETAPLRVGLAVSGICSNNGTATVTPSGGRPPYRYQWTTGATTASVSGLTQGYYNVTVYDRFNCEKDTAVYVSNALGTTLVATSNNATCLGINNGIATAHVMSGMGPYTFRWSNGATTQVLSNLPVGTYSVTMTDQAGCIKTSSTIISPNVTVSVVPTATATACGGSTGTLNATNVSGGTAPYRFLWSNNATTSTITNLAAGNYTVTATDNIGCRAVATATINSSGSNITATNSLTDASCSNANGRIQLTASNGTAPYTYRWSGGNNTTGIFNGLSAGTYSFTITDANNCATVVNGLVLNSINTLAPAGNVINNAVCGGSNGRITVTSSGGNAPVTYAWTGGNNATGVFTGLAPGTYNFSITDALGCTTTTSAVLGNNTPTISTTSPTVGNAACGGANGSISLTANGGTAPYTYRNGTTSNITGVFTGLAAGNYTISIIDANGCSATSSVINVGNTNALTANVPTVNNALCGGANGRATIVANNGTAPITYAWSGGNNTTGVFTNLAAGNYTFSLTDANGCTTTTTTTIDNTNVTITPSAPTVAAAACGGTNGSISLNATGGTAPYTYRTGTTSNQTGTFTGLASGNYTISITDANGCTTTTNAINVGNVNTLTANAPTVNNSLCGGANGRATIVANNGTAPITYRWSGGSNTTGVFIGLAAGNYTFSLTDANGCTTTTTAIIGNTNVTITPSAPTVVAAACGGTNGSISLNATGGTGPYTYRTGTTSNQTGAFTGLASGNYTISITDANGCTTTTNAINVGNVSTLAANVPTVNNAICTAANGRVALATTGGTTPITYRWSGGSNATGIFDTLRAGSYVFTITDANNCQTTVNATVGTNNPAIATTPVIQAATCNTSNGSVRLTGSGGTAPYRYIWSGGSNTTGVFDTLRGGNYTFTVTDANGCQSITPTQSVGNIGGVSAALSFTATACTGDSVRLRFTDQSTGAGVASREWRFGNSVSTAVSPDFTFNTLTGNVTLIVRSAQGCTDTFRRTFPIDVIRVTAPDSAMGCQNTTARINSVNNNPNFTPQYQWTPAALIASGGNTASPTINFGTAGTARLFLTVTNSIGCTFLDTVTVVSFNNTPIDNALITTAADCQDGLRVTFNNGNASSGGYTWIFGDGTSGTPANMQHLYATAGTYTVRLIPKVPCLDTVTRIITVTSGAAVNILASNDTTVCNTNAFNLTARSNVSNYTWSRNRNFTPVLGSTATQSIAPTTRGEIYYVRSVNAQGCTAFDSVIVSYAPVAIRRDSALATCVGADKQLTVTNLNAGDVLTYSWTPSTLVVSGGNTSTPTVRTTTSGNLIGVVTNQYGCTLRDTIRVTNTDLAALVTIDANPDTIYKDESSQLTVLPKDAGMTYTWTPTDGLSSTTIYNPIARPTTTTDYSVLVKDANGCTTTKTIRIKVLDPECGAPYVYVPNAFSPNGDNTNEIFYVRGEYLTEVDLIVYNRWGEEVYRIEKRGNIKDFGWNGTHKGAPVCPDVYGYYVTGLCKKGEKFFLKGNVTVLK
jgi:large repetitive protein